MSLPWFIFLTGKRKVSPSMKSVFFRCVFDGFATFLDILADAFHGAAAAETKQGKKRKEHGDNEDFFHDIFLAVDGYSQAECYRIAIEKTREVNARAISVSLQHPPPLPAMESEAKAGRPQ